jgi:uncharacterized protein (DUF362 family)
MPVSRREFLGGSVALASLAACRGEREATPEPAAARPRQTAVDGPPGTAAVVDVRGRDPAAMVAAALAALGGIDAFVTAGQRVVVKPNGAFPTPPEWGATTHPQTVAAVVRACLDAGAAEVAVIEYPSRGRGRFCLDRCGIAGALAGLPRVAIQVLDDGSEFRRVAIEGAAELTSVDIAGAVLDADVLINLPAAKAHATARVSFGLKNAMGLIRDRRALHRMDLDLAIADLARVIVPDLTLLDATRALLDNGPAGPGATATPGRIIAGRDRVAVDAVGLTTARFYGQELTPGQVPHLAHAARIGLGMADLDQIRATVVDA